MPNHKILYSEYYQLIPVNKDAYKFHENFIFRFEYCGLGEQQAADFAYVPVEQVHAWDNGEPIPSIVKRIWELESGTKMRSRSGFENWSFKHGRIITPDGNAYYERQILTALYFYELDNK